MCIFWEDDERPGDGEIRVSGTQLFARGHGPRQRLVYAMHLETAHAVAMILPLPVVPGSGEQAVEFIDLSGCPALFVELEACFQAEDEEDEVTLLGDDDAAPMLRVHAVGSFVATYVPRLADFGRLDPRFRLPDRIWQRLPNWTPTGASR